MSTCIGEEDEKHIKLVYLATFKMSFEGMTNIFTVSIIVFGAIIESPTIMYNKFVYFRGVLETHSFSHTSHKLKFIANYKIMKENHEVGCGTHKFVYLTFLLF